MTKKCIICDSEIQEEYEKLKGTIVKNVDNKKTNLTYVCSSCQKKDKWLEKAKIKAA